MAADDTVTRGSTIWPRPARVRSRDAVPWTRIRADVPPHNGRWALSRERTTHAHTRTDSAPSKLRRRRRRADDLLGRLGRAGPGRGRRSAHTVGAGPEAELETLHRGQPVRLRDREGTAGLRRSRWPQHQAGSRQTEGDRPRTSHRHSVLQPRRTRRARNGPDAAKLRVLPARGAGAVRHRQLGPPWHRQQHRGELLRESRGSRRLECEQSGGLPGGREGAGGLHRRVRGTGPAL